MCREIAGLRMEPQGICTIEGLSAERFLKTSQHHGDPGPVMIEPERVLRMLAFSVLKKPQTRVRAE